MVFLAGNHSVNIYLASSPREPGEEADTDYPDADGPVITTPVIRMIGEKEDTILSNIEFEPSLNFFDNAVVVLENLTLIEWEIVLQTTKESKFHISSAILL